jgi:hypothetical protein
MAKAKADLRSEERAPAVQRDASVPQGDTYRDTGAYTHKVREKKRREETGRQRDRHKSQSGRTQRTG